MPYQENTGQDEVAEPALASLWLTAHGGADSPRVWEGTDWDLMNLLHEKGWIGDPVVKQKSIELTEDGPELAQQ